MRIKLLNVAKKLNPLLLIKSLISFIKNFPKNARNIYYGSLEVGAFTILFGVFLINLPIVSLLKSPKIPQKIRIILLNLNKKITMLVYKLDKPDETKMNRLEIFELAFRSMTFKKTRTIITIGGMALGVGAIVFLVSIGYGLQKMVIDRVARLDELKQTDISTQPGSNVYLTDTSVRDFKEIGNVTDVLPLIGLVAKVNYQGSVSDVAVYGVTTAYLDNSAIKPVQGDLFESSNIVLNNESNVLMADIRDLELIENVKLQVDQAGEVAGAQVVRKDVKYGQKIQDIEFTIFPKTWLRVRAAPNTNAEIIGYTRRVEGVQQGGEYWGQEYYPENTGRVLQNASGQWLGKWINSTVYLWKEESCSKDRDAECEDGQYVPMRDERGSKIQATGYFAELEVLVDSVSYTQGGGEVLGLSSYGEVLAEEDIANEESTQDDTLLAQELDIEALLSDQENETATPAEDAGNPLTDEFFVDLEIESSESSAATSGIKKVSLPPEAQKETVVNIAFLKLLGLDKTNPIGKTFETSFIVTSNLIENSTDKVESMPVEYKIVGVIPGDNTPFFYVPLGDLRHLGITRFSQVKLIAKDTENLAAIREKVEASGFITTSVVDTVEQINRLFGTIRLVLALIGAVALGVASLGMFNTLTVSLLERTREVGLMKAMGMTSHEVKRLFLTESMLMGFIGGIMGILMGFLAGKSVSLLLSVVGVAKGAGFIDISYIPMSFVLLVFFLSLIVGVGTGVYPSRRATNISALNALRYE